MSEKVDRFGAFASSLCAAHCALCALLPAAFSVLGVSFLAGHEAEWLFTLVAIAFASGALVLGWRQHGSKRVAGLLAIGIIGLLVSRGLEMGGEHHGEHGDEHAAAANHESHEKGHSEHGEKADNDANKNHDSHDDDHDDHGGHDDFVHLAGASVGVLAGVILLFGHIANIRESRKCQKDCC